MRFVRLCGAAGLVGCLCFGQDYCGIPKLGASAEASAALERISDAVGFVRGRILLFTSSDPIVGSKGGAMSLVCVAGNGEERWIVYDPGLVRGDLARDFTLAHETAHHLNDDPRAPGQWSKQQELDADEFGSEYLTRLGWTRDKLLQALDSLGLPKASVSGYPTLDERRAAVIKGFEEESARLGGGGRGTEPSKPPPGPTVDINVFKAQLEKLIDGRGDLHWEINQGTNTDSVSFGSLESCSLHFEHDLLYWNGNGILTIYTVPMSEVRATLAKDSGPVGNFAVELSVPDEVNSIVVDRIYSPQGREFHEKTSGLSIPFRNENQARSMVDALNGAIQACRK